MGKNVTIYICIYVDTFIHTYVHICIYAIYFNFLWAFAVKNKVQQVAIAWSAKLTLFYKIRTLFLIYDMIYVCIYV